MDENQSTFQTINSGISTINRMIVTVFEDYGWIMLIAGLVTAYLYQTKVRPALRAYQKKRDEEEYAAKYHKNPDLFSQRLQAQQGHAEKLQAEYQRQAEEFKQKQLEKQQKRREEKLGAVEGHKLGPSSSLKPDYNPLMGPGSSNYRPPKRSACSKGGCGR